MYIIKKILKKFFLNSKKLSLKQQHLLNLEVQNCFFFSIQ